MVHAVPTPALDSLLAPFVHAADQLEAEQALATLVDAHAAPVVQQVVRRHLTARRGDAEDAAADVSNTALLRLTRHFWQVRRGEADPVASVAGYAAQTAANACHEWLRARRPRRARLQQRVRYVFRHHPSLAMWAHDRDGWVCGRAEWQARDDVRRGIEAATWTGRLTAPTRGEGGEAARLVALIESIVDALAGPARLEDIVNLAADALGIDDMAVSPRDEAAPGAAVVETLPAREAPVDQRLAHAEFLARAWKEIVELPLRQRTALLLNLTSPDGGDLLSLVPVTGLATWSDIASLLSLPALRMREIAAALPHDDHRIAGLLGVTRRQVINLRKCARERLARRLGITRGREGGRR